MSATTLRPGAWMAVIAAVLMTVLIARPSAQNPTDKIMRLVAPTTLRGLLPTLPGWTKTRAEADEVALSADCRYTFATAIYLNAAMNVRVTLADTGSDVGSLASLATIVTTFPDGAEKLVPPATTIKRMAFNGFPGASLWDSGIFAGEFSVLVGGRFVAKAEGTHLDSVDSLRTIVEQIDLKALAALK